LLVIVGLVWGGFWWCNKKTENLEKQKDKQIVELKKDKSKLKKQLAEEKVKYAKLSTSNQSSCKSPSATAIENIKDSVTSKNTAALEGYMANKLDVILAASEGVGERTPTQAVSDTTGFISDAEDPWNFALPAAILSSYADGSYGKYFPDGAVVGKSADGKVIAFSFDCNGEIKTVFYTPDSGLL
jgi:hypothetical protein